MKKILGMAVFFAVVLSGAALADSFSIRVGDSGFSLGINSGNRHCGYVERVAVRPVVVYEPVVIYKKYGYERRVYSRDRHRYCNEREHGWHGHHGWE